MMFRRHNVCAGHIIFHTPFFFFFILRPSQDLSLYLGIALHHSSSEQYNALDRQWCAVNEFADRFVLFEQTLICDDV